MENRIQAVLFDLDGTLLDNNMDVFLAAYLELLSARVAHLVPPPTFVAHLMRASEAMVRNDGRATNEQVFAGAFYPLAGRSRRWPPSSSPRKRGENRTSPPAVRGGTEGGARSAGLPSRPSRRPGASFNAPLIWVARWSWRPIRFFREWPCSSDWRGPAWMISHARQLDEKAPVE